MLHVTSHYHRYPSDEISSPKGLQNRQRMEKIGELLPISFRAAGDCVEIGCYKGGTTLFLRKMMKHCRAKKDLHVFDSFEGLPKSTEYDSNKSHTSEKACACSISEFKRNWDNEYELPQIHKGWIEDTLHELPAQICFALIDLDLYEGTKTALEAVYPNLSRGAIVVIDDYTHFVFGPGIQRAIRDFICDKPESIHCDSQKCKHKGRTCHNAWFQKT